MEYIFDNSMTSTNPQKENKKWTIEKVYNNEYYTLDELVKSLGTVHKLLLKYPNDEYVQVFEEILRDEICMMFGGTIDE